MKITNSRDMSACRVWLTPQGARYRSQKNRLQLRAPFRGQVLDVVEVIRKETRGEMCDVVVDVSGNPNAILKSVDCLHRQATMVLAGLTGDTTVTPMLMDKLVWGEIKLQGCFTADNDATEAAHRLIEETKFPVQEMVSHVFPLKDIEKCIRAVGGEVPEMFPTKALINPSLG